MQSVPEVRIRRLNDATVPHRGQFVLYWMIANRRTSDNFSLQRAVEWAVRLKQPLLIFEALRVKYRWASDRLHRFVIQGMANQKRVLAPLPATYYPYIEPTSNAGRGLLESLAAQASAVVTDDFPTFFIPTMLRFVGRKLKVPLEAVDSNGLFPMRATETVFTTAHSFRRHLQKNLRLHLTNFPEPSPLEAAHLCNPVSVPEWILEKWPVATEEQLTASSESLAALAIDHSVGPAAFDGGSQAANRQLQRFLKHGLDRYEEDHNHPDLQASSQLSPYLHFGQISTHTVMRQLIRREGWIPEHLSPETTGSREGWWGMSPAAESFLDELITWRELGYNMCCHRSDYDQFQSLPEWALKTIQDHDRDIRPVTYSLEQFENATTHDDIWNAAQRQLVREGQMHNYLRMLWGKKIYEWSPTAEDALQIMIELNNKYAVDGRNPNSYSGIFWVLGRYDRAWGPEREIFGKLRYMTSDSTRRKLKLSNYLHRYAQ